MKDVYEDDEAPDSADVVTEDEDDDPESLVGDEIEEEA